MLEGNVAPGGASGGSSGGYTDPLVEMGLFDPSSIRLADAGLVPGEEGSEEILNPEERGEETPVVDWDSEDNPYRQQVKELQTQIEQTGYRANPQADLAQQEIQIQRDAQVILNQLINQQKMDPQVAQIMVNLATQNALLEARHTAERQVLMPAAKREVAQRIAKEFSTRKVPVNIEDLMKEPTVEAMRTAARLTVSQTRDGAFQARKNGNTDRAESSGGRRQIDESALNAMSPQQKIQYGLRHQRGARGE